MQISLPKETVERVVNYLVTRPWTEVNPLIQEIQREGRVVETDPCPTIVGDNEEGTQANED